MCHLTPEQFAAIPSDFIRDAIKQDLAEGRFDRVHTRFPPEPNAYLHIGHTKALWINYGIAQDFGGKFNLRFDDTNPEKEEQEFVDGIIEDVHWVLSLKAPPLVLRSETEGGVGEGDNYRPEVMGPLFASDYFEQMFEWAKDLIRKGKAYVCDLTADEVRETRGTLTEPGTNSPFRERSVEENLDLFERMKDGEFPDGTRTLRAKIDMASPNLVMRDPVMYRILHAEHHRQGGKWCVYPMYDWAHGLEDSIEGVTHSLCSLEYVIHRPLYDWFLDELGIYHPRQIEFPRLNITYTVMSKRRFIELVNGGHVSGYDDPRLPTLVAMRRRGYTPEAIKEFVTRVGLTKADSVIEAHVLEDCVREDLNKHASRVMGVLNPLRVVITNFPEGQIEEMDAVNNPEDPEAGTRKVPFGRELYIEREDFMEEPPPKFFRLAPGREVRLRYAYFITCQEVVKDASGEIAELRCTYDPATKGGDAPDGRKVKATMHWVAAETAVKAEVRLYDHLFRKPNPDEAPEGGSYLDNLNPNSLKVVQAFVEPSVKDAPAGTRYQFERMGYFCVDKDSSPGNLVFNRTATLRDAWANIQKAGGG
ncbi:MAG: glutamine--tRNA ligase/YqeY domain fusion protein [Armatimonadetes bacterium]|nr:glutamine--tRNA ligase/YqeY domain fusion protein [Armatimonadota bacterium]